MADVLVLGGTGWLGGQVARTALAQGHAVTCLARGVSGGVPEGARWVQGDREDPGTYAAASLAQEWDLVVDVSRQPGHVAQALDALSERAAGWAFVSTCSVYARHDEPGADETAALLPAASGPTVDVTEYGEGKVACEEAVTAHRGPAAVIARAGLIVGPGDGSERFGYWPAAFDRARGSSRSATPVPDGPVLVPARSDRPAQWVDVRDLAAWLLDCGLTGPTGICNAVGAAVPLADVLAAARQVAGHRGEVVAASDEALVAAGIEPFMGPRSLPYWLPDADSRAFCDRSAGRAAAAGLRTRPLLETMADTLEWERRLGVGRDRTRAGLTRADELAVLATLT